MRACVRRPSADRAPTGIASPPSDASPLRPAMRSRSPTRARWLRTSVPGGTRFCLALEEVEPSGKSHKVRRRSGGQPQNADPLCKARVPSLKSDAPETVLQLGIEDFHVVMGKICLAGCVADGPAEAPGHHQPPHRSHGNSAAPTCTAK